MSQYKLYANIITYIHNTSTSLVQWLLFTNMVFLVFKNLFSYNKLLNSAPHLFLASTLIRLLYSYTITRYKYNFLPGWLKKIQSSLPALRLHSVEVCRGHHLATDSQGQGHNFGSNMVRSGYSQNLGEVSEVIQLFHAQLSWVWNLSCSYMLKCQQLLEF